jgi:DNA repair protein RadC
MREFGSLHNLFEADATEIQRRCGLSENTATLLSMVIPLARRYDISKWGRRINFASTKSLANYVKTLFIGQTVECFYLLCLDNRASLISATLLERGTLDRAELYPREIMKCVMNSDAAFVILAHNHPSGSLDISDADVLTTRRLISMLSEVEVGVLDHIICCGKNYISFAEKRILGLKGIEGIFKSN